MADTNDGYTHHSYIKGVPRLYDECRFDHRPITYPQQRVMLDDLERHRGAEYARRVAEIIAKFVVKWSAVDRAGKPIPTVAAKILADAEPKLIENVLAVVLRLAAPDIDPNDKEPSEQSATSLDALLEGTSQSALAEANDAKKLIGGLKLLLFYPEVAARTCEACQRDWYDDHFDKESGAWKFSTKVIDRPAGSGNKLPRPPGTLPPCMQKSAPCPKVSPDRAAEFELSPKNVHAVEFYRQTQACCGANLTEREREDETLKRNLSVIHTMFKTHEQIQVLKAAGGK